MQVPSLRPERARSLYRAGITTVEELSKVERVQELVNIFIKGDGFVTHAKSNSEDLNLKYSYLYSFSHKILSEAKTLTLKKQFDPD